MSQSSSADAVPSGALPGRHGAGSALAPRRRWLACLLVVLVAIPAALGLALAGQRAADALHAAGSYGQAGQLAVAGQQVNGLAQAMEDERSATATFITNSRPAAGLPALHRQYAITDSRAAAVRRLVLRLGRGYPAQTRANAAAVLASIAELPGLRGRAAQAQTSAVAAMDGYSAATAGLFGLGDRIAGPGGSALGTSARAAGSLARMIDQAAQQQAILGVALAQGHFQPGALAALSSAQARQASEVRSFRSSATAQEGWALTQTLARPLARQAQAVEQRAIAAGAGPLALGAQASQQWQAGMSYTIGWMRHADRQLTGWIAADAQSQRRSAMRLAAFTAGGALAGFLLVLAAVLVARSVARRRREAAALEDADEWPPAQIRELGAAGGWGHPVPVTPGDALAGGTGEAGGETGEAAGAFVPGFGERFGEQPWPGFDEGPGSGAAFDLGEVPGLGGVRGLGEMPGSGGVPGSGEVPGLGEVTGSGEVPGLAAVPGFDDIPGLVPGFDGMHPEAVPHSGEDARLRASAGAISANFSRRSHTLLERLLRLIDNLELSEDDPERLASLFQLDHLATRIWRNSDSALVLTGHQTPRQPTEPLPLVDVLRGAVSEIEDYDRVVLKVQQGVSVSGHAATGTVHLLAELLENATTFSPGTTQVIVYGHAARGGTAHVSITDSGTGMPDEQLRQLNWRLAHPSYLADVAAARHIGLFAVAHLAARHGITVALRRPPDGGTTAEIHLPAALISLDTTPGPWPEPAGAAPGAGADEGTGATERETGEEAGAWSEADAWAGTGDAAGAWAGADDEAGGWAGTGEEAGAWRAVADLPFSALRFAARPEPPFDLETDAPEADMPEAVPAMLGAPVPYPVAETATGVTGPDADAVEDPEDAGPGGGLPIFDSVRYGYPRSVGRDVLRPSDPQAGQSPAGHAATPPAAWGHGDWRATAGPPAAAGPAAGGPAAGGPAPDGPAARGPAPGGPAAGGPVPGGLPSRVPQPSRVAGAAAGRDTPQTTVAVSAEMARSKLASFQRGSRRAREAARMKRSASQPNQDRSPSQPGSNGSANLPGQDRSASQPGPNGSANLPGQDRSASQPGPNGSANPPGEELA